MILPIVQCAALALNSSLVADSISDSIRVEVISKKSISRRRCPRDVSPDHRVSTLMTASQIKKKRRAITPWVVNTLPVFAPASTPSSPIASRSSF